MEQEKHYGFKAFDKKLKCRNKQYEIGKTYKVEGGLSLCENGIHFCKQPLDVLEYYPRDSRFARIIAYGKLVSDDTKSATLHIELVEELSFAEMFNEHLNAAFADLDAKTSHSQTSGDSSHSQTSGDSSHSQTSGYRSHSQTSGYSSHSQTSGYSSHSQTSGDRSHSQTSGDRSHSQTSGDSSHSQTSGEQSIACALGKFSKAQAKNKGWIVVVDWQKKSGEWFIKNIHKAETGQKIKGVVIQAGFWYWFEDGVLKECAN